MTCPRCLAQIPDGNSFCPGCGLKIRMDAAPAPGPSPQQHAQAPAQYDPPPLPPPEQGYPPQVPAYWQGQPPGAPGYPAPQSGAPARHFDRDMVLLIIGIIYVAFYFLVSAVVILFNASSSGAQAINIMGTIGAFAALAVPGYALMKRGRYDPAGLLVMLAAAAAAFFVIIATFTSSSGFAKFVAVIAGVAVIGAQSALLLMMDADRQWFTYAKYVAVAIAWVAGLVVAITTLKMTSSSGFTSLTGLSASLKAMSFFLILDLCASIAAILLWRLALKSEGQDVAGAFAR